MSEAERARRSEEKVQKHRMGPKSDVNTVIELLSSLKSLARTQPLKVMGAKRFLKCQFAEASAQRGCAAAAVHRAAVEE